jgi:hypothetical protein
MARGSDVTKSLTRLAARVAARLEGQALTLDASLYQARIRCGRTGCRCMRSTYRHGMWCLSRVRDGKSLTRTVPEAALAEVRKLCQAHRELRAMRRELRRLARETVALLDQHGRAMAKRGWRRFEQLKEAGR